MSSAQGIMQRSRLGGPLERRALRRCVGSAAPRLSGRIDSVQVGARSGQEESSLEDELQKNKQVRSGIHADDPSLSEKPAYKGAGEAECKNCGFLYTPQKGDISYPVSKGTQFPDLPDDWTCPICGTEKQFFQSKAKRVAGFEQNQGYGLGSNSLTSEQKSILIYGALFFFFLLFLSGYFLD